jgi:hypothetical protein
MKDFSNEEVNFIKNNYLMMSDKEIAILLNRTELSVHAKRVRMRFLKEQPNEKITEEEKQNIIQDYLNNISINELSKKYNRFDSSIIRFLKVWNIFKPQNNRWTKNEIKILREIYPFSDWDNILKLIPKHSKEVIIAKAYKLNIKKEDYYWTENDINILKEEYNKATPIKKIVKLLNNKFSETAIATKANRLDFKKVFKWEDWEIEYLKNNYSSISLDEICTVLVNRKRNNIIIKAMKLELNGLNTYKEKEINFIKINYKFLSDKEMSKYLNRDWRSIQAKRLNLGLKKEVKKGIYESIDIFLRKQLKQWKKESAKNCGYKCILTGQRFQAIHHVHSLNLIIDEVFNESDIKVKENFEDYSTDEIELIKNKFFEIHQRYPLGVCLTKEIHDLFHFEYGFGNNTPEQFEEFKMRYRLGEFKKIV